MNKWERREVIITRTEKNIIVALITFIILIGKIMFESYSFILEGNRLFYFIKTIFLVIGYSEAFLSYFEKYKVRKEINFEYTLDYTYNYESSEIYLNRVDEFLKKSFIED